MVQLSAGASLTTAVWRGGLRAQAMREASDQIDATLDHALRLALCPGQPDADDVRAAAQRLHRQLDEKPIPDGDAPGPFTRSGRAVVRVLPGIGSRLPAAAAHGHESLAALLCRWLEEALPAQAGVACDGVAVTRAALIARFPSAFFIALDDARTTRWRGALLDGLRAADERDDWRGEKRRLHERALFGAAGGGAVVVGATALAGAGDTTALMAGGIAAVVTAGTGELTGRRRNEEATPATADEAVRDGVRAWLRDTAVALGYATCAEPYPALLWLAGLEGPAKRSAVSRKLLDDLGLRLRPAATAAGDERLATGLFALHDALVREARGSCDAPSARSALERVVALVATGDSARPPALARHEIAPPGGGRLTP